MKKYRVKLNKQGVGEFLRSSDCMKIVEQRADNALRQLGDGYEKTTKTGRTRVNAEIKTASFSAMRENARSNSILKSLR